MLSYLPELFTSIFFIDKNPKAKKVESVRDFKYQPADKV